MARPHGAQLAALTESTVKHHQRGLNCVGGQKKGNVIRFSMQTRYFLQLCGEPWKGTKSEEAGNTVIVPGREDGSSDEGVDKGYGEERTDFRSLFGRGIS